MSTDAPTTKNGIDSVPADAALLGIDGDGARHYVSNPIHGDVTVYVKEATGVQTFDLAETPCDGVGGPDVEAAGWYDHVDAKRGWDILADDILTQQLSALDDAQRQVATGAHQ